MAYLVDAGTAEHHELLSSGLREYDVTMALTNIVGELMDLQAGQLLDDVIDPVDIGETLAQRYQALWAALTVRETVRVGETYRVDARIRALNEMAFDVAELEIVTEAAGDYVQVQPKVVDAGHHARRLLRLTGLDVEENQARRLLTTSTPIGRRAGTTARPRRSSPTIGSMRCSGPWCR